MSFIKLTATFLSYKYLNPADYDNIFYALNISTFIF